MSTDQSTPISKFSRRHLLEILGVSIVVVLVLLLLPNAGRDSRAYPADAKPLPPTNLRSDPGVNNIELTWYPSPSMGLKGYLVYRSEGLVGSAPLPPTVTFGLAYPDPVQGDRWVDYGQWGESLQPGLAYYYYLVSVDLLKETGDPSNISNSSQLPEASSDDFTYPEPGEPPPPPPPPEPPPPEPPIPNQKVRLFVPDSGAQQSNTVTVPVKIGNADNLSIFSADMWVTYNPNVILGVDIKPTTLLRDYIFASNTGRVNQGVINALVVPGVGIPPTHTVYGEATLFDVVFHVTGTKGMTTTMSTPYTYTIEGNVYGTTIYTNEFAALNAITLPVIYESGIFTVTDNITPTPDITPTSYLMGDVEPAGKGNKVVNNKDFKTALALATGTESPNHRQKQVGDMNGDERINSADAALILRESGGLVTVLSSKQAKLMQSLMGASTAEPVTVQAGWVAGMRGEKVSVPINVTNAAPASSPASGIDLVVNYYDKQLQLDDVTPGSLAANFEISFTQGSTQTVKIALAHKSPGGEMVSPGTGELLNLEFTIKPGAPYGWWPVTLASARLSDSYGRDFATSDLQIPVYALSGGVGQHVVYLPIVLRKL